MAATTRLTRRLWLLTAAAGMVTLALWSTLAERAAYIPAGSLRVGVDPSNPPFAFYEGDALAGFEIELARLLGEQLGLPVQFVALGFDGLYDAIKTDQVDVMLATLTPDAARTADVIYSSAYFDNGLVLIADSGTSFQSFEAIAGRSLAYAYGSAAHAEADRWLRRITSFATQPYELPTYALDAVRLGDADAALVSAIDARLYLRVHAEWETLSSYVTSAPYVVAVRRDRDRLLERILAALAALETDGRIDALGERWL